MKAKQLCATGVAKLTPAVLRAIKGAKVRVARSNLKLIWGHADPGNKRSPMWTSAHGAVTVAAEQRRQGNIEPYRSAKAGSAYGFRIAHGCYLTAFC